MEQQKYQMIVTWSTEDQAYLVGIPELPGCIADGKTRREAVDNAEIVIQEWLETAGLLNRPIPLTAES
ncbi:MAG TPA: type II toxin-antitoxin system HicB family antitoxin [Anaerolineales bacterium]